MQGKAEEGRISDICNSDATYRKKGNNAACGYVCNLTETCSKENEAQFITDYTLEKNTVDDVDMVQDRIKDIKQRTNLEDLYVDGGYYGETVDQVAQENDVTMHYSAMTGKFLQTVCSS